TSKSTMGPSKMGHAGRRTGSVEGVVALPEDGVPLGPVGRGGDLRRAAPAALRARLEDDLHLVEAFLVGGRQPDDLSADGLALAHGAELADLEVSGAASDDPDAGLAATVQQD